MAIKEVYMSCGHYQKLDIYTIGEQLRIDMNYYARQGLCSDCWKRLIEERNAERKELAEKRKSKEVAKWAAC